MQPGITMKQISDITGLSQLSCSRNIAALSQYHRRQILGHNPVKAEEGPAERRRKIVNLTEKGKRVAKSIWYIIETNVVSDNK